MNIEEEIILNRFELDGEINPKRMYDSYIMILFDMKEGYTLEDVEVEFNSLFNLIAEMNKTSKVSYSINNILDGALFIHIKSNIATASGMFDIFRLSVESLNKFLAEIIISYNNKPVYLGDILINMEGRYVGHFSATYTIPLFEDESKEDAVSVINVLNKFKYNFDKDGEKVISEVYDMYGKIEKVRPTLLMDGYLDKIKLTNLLKMYEGKAIDDNRKTLV